jgi:hypothetical protein
MKIGIYILNLDMTYFPEMWDICYPSISNYAKKINATLYVINERKFPDWHITYEKAQVYELGKENDWNIVMDTDILIHPDMPDVTQRVPEFAIGLRDSYPADSLFKLQPYFFRDRRKIGISGVFAMASKYCHDFWMPLEGIQEDHTAFIQPWNDEIERGVHPSHFITEYWQSSNLARYGLQFSGILNDDERWMFHHSYNARTNEQKLQEALLVLNKWNDK